MKKILLSGSNGRMGKVLQQLIAQDPELVIVAGIDRHPETASGFPVYQQPEEVKEEIDLVIDFSHYSVVPDLLNVCVERGWPIVVATTGLPKETNAMLAIAAKVIPVFYSANMSLGINVLIKALQAISPALAADFDIEIIEKHHNQKKDAPSGTALLLADKINEVLPEKKTYVYGRSGTENENPKNELGIHAVRGGTIPGEHTVLYAGPDEIIELTHTALSRDIFANGALKAANFLLKQPAGLYSMADLLK
ncbi:4-hydroxy-tetrahydrodipicolinate reductase [Enterococcus mediterraneensis]|uniref:4-hydroxy-tetrahydrodipicolinate reductase n=1 Tax=Enterococcus mediterraneensis TaxID=2364791 RepID=UPI000F0713FD|nr:4-hydroxy-tetrahydrodipicolinate reductase [Enterococcus mediterraneensis]